MKEDLICKAFINQIKQFELLKQILVEELLYFHIPNGGKRNAWEGKKFKDMGVLPGIPDYQFIWKDNNLVKLGFLEFKTLKGTLSVNQKVLKESIGKMNIPYEIARSVDDGVNILKKWGIIK